jgi:hypothetical protein
MCAPVAKVGRRHQHGAQKVGGDAAGGNRGAAQLYVPARRGGEQNIGQSYTAYLLDKMYQSALPHPAAGGEIAAEHRGEGYKRHAQGEYAQTLHRSGVAYPQKAHGLGEIPQHRAGRKPEKQAVAYAPSHGAANTAPAAQPQLLGYESGGGKAYAGYGHGGRQPRHRHHQLEKPYPRRAYPPRQPDLIGHADAAHHDGGAGQQGGIKDKSAFFQAITAFQ